MVSSGVDICNLAITRQGGEAIDALDEESPLAQFCQTAWPQKRSWLLAKHRWVFATRIVQLARRVTTPTGCPLSYAFDRPGDVLGAIHAFRAGPRRDDQRVEVYQTKDFIACDTTTVWVEYSANVGEGQWPPWFVELAVVAFQADVASRMGNDQAAYSLTSRAFGSPNADGKGGLFADAMEEDGRNASQRQLFYDDGGPLVNARFSNFDGLGFRWGGDIIDFT